MTAPTPTMTVTVTNVVTGEETTEPCYEMPTGLTPAEFAAWMQEMVEFFGLDD